MEVTRQEVIEALGRVVTRGVRLIALADDMGLRKQDHAQLRALLTELVGEGKVEILPGSAFALAASGRAEADGDGDGSGRRRRRRTTVATEAPPVSAGAVPPPRALPRKPSLPWSGRRVGHGGDGADKKAPAPAPVAAPPAPTVAPVVAAAAKRGKIVKGRVVGAPDPQGRPIGRITVHPAGYGFVSLDDGTDVFVPAKYRGASLDGDRVILETWTGIKGTEGRVIEIVARGRARLTGILRRTGRSVWIEPDDPRIAGDYGRVALDDAAPQGHDGDAVVAEITRYPDVSGGGLGARLLKVLGDPDDPRTEIEKILAVSAVPTEFPDDALQQAEITAQEVGPVDLADRIDLRDRRFCTIDPETARDFDDALCIETGPHGGPRVWVAVADVSHYVRWGDALDRESTIRGVSVYLPDRVIPMLPHQLSSGICSLNPNVDRCAMVVRLDYTDDGELLDTGYAAAVIRSQARLDYPGAAAALGGDFRGRREMYRGWEDELHALNRLAQKLRVRRRARGALDLDIPEPKVILDADDARLVRDVVRAKGDPEVKKAYELVEEFMIAANEAVGAFFRKRDVPTVWRVHAPPDPDRVATLAELLGAYGIHFDIEEATTPLGMKWVLDQVLTMPASRSLSFLVLRTLTQAVWDTVPVGHFGLASGDYLHFTSPIRRYPDLLVHRLLKYYLHRDGQPSGSHYRREPPTIERLSELAAASSAHERRAMEAEREAVAMYRAYLVREQIGEHYTGTISAVTSFGAFVEIDEPFVEGLIKLDSLGEDFGFDELHMRLRGRRSGLTIALGDTVTVEIQNVSVLKRRVDLALVSGGKVRGRDTAEEASSGNGDRRRRRRAERPTERDRPAARPHREAATTTRIRPLPTQLEPEPVVEAAPVRETRVGLAGKRKAGRAVEKAVVGRVEKGAARRTGAGAGAGGKMRLKVSHRGPGRADDTGGSRPRKGKVKPKAKKR
jgi:ribonuclease R